MSETPGHEVGDVVDGRRWNGQDWEAIQIGDTAEPGSGALPPPTGDPVEPPTLLGEPQPGGPAYGEPALDGAAAGAGPSPFAAAAPLFFLGVLVAVGVSIAGIWVVNSRGGGFLWWGGYIVTFGLWRSAFARYKEVSEGSAASLSQRGLVMVIAGALVAVASAGAFAYAWAKATTAPRVTNTVGSCWVKDGEQFYPSDCGDAAAIYVVLSEEFNESFCSSESYYWVESPTKGKVLCMGLKS